MEDALKDIGSPLGSANASPVIGTIHEPKSPRDIFDVPEGMSKAEWLRINTEGEYQFFHLMYLALVAHECTPQTCPDMSAGPQYQFWWAEGSYASSPVSLPAPEYITLLVKWADERLAPFGPFSEDATISKEFQAACEQIWSRTLRIVMHIYCSHWTAVTQNNAGSLIHNFTKHFIIFAMKYKLLKSFESVAPISPILAKLLPAYYKQQLEELGKDGSTKLKEREKKVGQRRTTRRSGLANIRRQALLVSAQQQQPEEGSGDAAEAGEEEDVAPSNTIEGLKADPRKVARASPPQTVRRRNTATDKAEKSENSVLNVPQWSHQS